MNTLLIGAGVVLLLAWLHNRAGGANPDGVKTFVEKTLDELAASENWLRDWGSTNDDIDKLTGTIKSPPESQQAQGAGQGTAIVTSDTGMPDFSGSLPDMLKDALLWVFEQISPKKHWCYFPESLLTQLGEVLAVDPSKPMDAVIVVKFVVTMPMSGDERAELTKDASYTYQLFNTAGQTIGHGNLPAGTYFALAHMPKITTGTAASLTVAAMTDAKTLRVKLTEHSAIASSPMFIMSKESLIARVDP